MPIINSLSRRDTQALAEPLVATDSRYLTDGCRPFRRASSLSNCPAGLVWLEDCRSLTVVFATTEEASALAAPHGNEDETGGPP
jgi:hypothetical protein